jgi:MFS family permease
METEGKVATAKVLSKETSDHGNAVPCPFTSAAAFSNVLGMVLEHKGRATSALHWAGALGGLSQSLSGAAGALLVRDVTGREVAAGWPQAALVAGAAVAAIALSRLTRRRGRPAALVTGSAAATIGAVVVALAGISGSLGGILVGSALLGSGNTTVMLGRYTAAELATPAGRARAMGWVLAATSVGAVAGPNLLGPSAHLAGIVGLPVFTGAYVVAAAGFAITSVVLGLGLRDAFVRPVDRPRTATWERRRPAVLDAGGARAIAVLACANLVMVTVMTMAPIHLHHHGTGLGMVGLIVGVHIAGMFLPSPLSGWATDRFGSPPVVVASGVVLVLACAVTAVGAGSTVLLVVGLSLLGVGWNLALVAGSTWLAADADPLHRPLREGWGEVGMGIAAAAGGVGSGLLVDVAGYPMLAATCGVFALGLVSLALVRVPMVGGRQEGAEVPRVVSLEKELIP